MSEATQAQSKTLNILSNKRQPKVLDRIIKNISIFTDKNKNTDKNAMVECYLKTYSHISLFIFFHIKEHFGKEKESFKNHQMIGS